MNKEPIKGTNPETTTNPETIISLEQDIIKFKIEINKLENKILESQHRILLLKNKNNIFDDSVFADEPPL